MCTLVEIIQSCDHCLKKCEDAMLTTSINCVAEECDDCSDLCNEGSLQPCETCLQKGHIYSHPAFRACSLCITRGTCCTKAWVAVWASDCEQIYKSAMELFTKAKESGELKSVLSLMEVCPEMVHVAKRLHGSLSNWFLLVNGQRANAVFIRALRQGNPTLQKLVSAASVRRKDRMDFSSIIDICQRKVLEEIQSISKVTVTLIPERYQLWKSNQKGVVKQPVDVDMGPYGTILVLDYAGKLLKGRLHYPVDVSVITSGLSKPTSVAFGDGIAFVCEPGKSQVSYVDVAGKLKITPANMCKADLVKKCVDLILCASNEEALSQTRKSSKWLTAQNTDSEKSKHKILQIAGLHSPLSVACSESGKTLFVADIGCHCIWMAQVQVIGVHLECFVTKLISLPVTYQPYGMCMKSNLLYLTSPTIDGGLFCCDASQDIPTLTKLVAGQNIHSVCMYGESALAYSDRSKNIVQRYDLHTKEELTISGCGTKASSDGKSTEACHSQPLGLCSENETLFVVDGAGMAVRMVSGTDGLHEYLQNLKKAFESFSIHDRRVTDESQHHTIEEAILKISDVCSFFQRVVSEIRGVTNKPRYKPQGPEGSPAYKTIESLQMIEKALEGLRSTLQKSNPDYIKCLNLLSTLTLVVEHHFSAMRSRYPVPLIMEYAQQLLPTVKETLKRITSGCFKYYTNRQSYYPLPDSAVSLEDLQFPKKCVRGKTSVISSEDKILLQSWRRKYCPGVRQKTVRQQSTMYSAGTLPISCYEASAIWQVGRG